MSDRVVVIGDVILDEEVHLRAGGFGAEEVATYFEVSRRSLAGGAANVAKNLLRLGARVCMIHQAGLISFRDDDLTPAELLRLGQVSLLGNTMTKVRYYCGGRKVFKVNVPSDISVDDIPSVADELDRVLRSSPYEIVVACDNGLGTLLGEEEDIVSICRRHGRELVVDAQLSQTTPDFSAWSGATEIMLNSDEAEEIGSDIVGFERWHKKLGQDGSLHWDGNHLHRQWGFPVEARDTVGAGDAYLAAWVRTRDLRLANLWAALSCTKIGTALPAKEELDEALARLGEP